MIATNYCYLHKSMVKPNNFDEDHLTVVLLQADGRRDLQSTDRFFRNRGDPSDPYPGTTKNFLLGSTT